MLSGKLPFAGETEAATWKSVVQTDPAPLPQHISSDVKKLVTIMLTKSPDRRPSIDQIVLTKLVTRYVKLLVGYGRLAKNQYEVLKGPVDPRDEDAESKPSIPRTKRAPVKEEGPPKERTKTRERQKEEMKGAIEAKSAVRPEEKQAKDPSKGLKEEVKVEKKEIAKESVVSAKKEAEIPK
jgi:serine/threonine protein kinase